jgi:hypothetical protein
MHSGARSEVAGQLRPSRSAGLKQGLKRVSEVMRPAGQGRVNRPVRAMGYRSYGHQQGQRRLKVAQQGQQAEVGHRASRVSRLSRSVMGFSRARQGQQDGKQGSAGFSRAQGQAGLAGLKRAGEG